MAADGRIKVHLDTDIGGDIDDLCALALLLAREDVELTGVTTVLEVEGRRAGYARYVLGLGGRAEVPVAAGAEATLARFRPQMYGLYPEERYWGRTIAPAPGPLDAALDLLQQSIEAGAVIVPVGPLTNLSLLGLRSPAVLEHATICAMGGSIQPPPPGVPDYGNENDFNFQADPEAAKHVLGSSDPERTTIVPLEVTAQTALRRASIPALLEAGPIGRLLARQAEACAEDDRIEERFGRKFEALPDDTINFQHDPLACAVALGWKGVTVERLPLTVTLEDGWLHERLDPAGRPFRVVTAVDTDRFDTFWLESVVEGLARHRRT